MRYLANFMLLVEYDLYMKVAGEMYDMHIINFSPQTPNYWRRNAGRAMSEYAQQCLEQYQNFQP